MENKVIQDRLALLRAKMQEEGIDFLYDAHSGFS